MCMFVVTLLLIYSSVPIIFQQLNSTLLSFRKVKAYGNGSLFIFWELDLKLLEARGAFENKGVSYPQEIN